MTAGSARLSILAARWAALLLAVLSLAACGEDGSRTAPNASSTVSAPAAPRGDPAEIARGGDLFRQNCASCHGDKAQGAFNWQKPGPDGKYLPPPLNGTGHAWHHPQAALKATIRDGTIRLGGSMPSWRDKLSDSDIDAIILWFQSFWPDEIYQAWRQMDERARRG